MVKLAPLRTIEADSAEIPVSGVTPRAVRAYLAGLERASAFEIEEWLEAAGVPAMVVGRVSRKSRWAPTPGASTPADKRTPGEKRPSKGR
jgi:hypothetical protein